MARRTNDWITSFLSYTDNSEPPKLYKEWVAVSVIAACLRRKCVLEWGPLRFYPNMYIVLIGPSGKCKKGTIMDVGSDFLDYIGVHTAAEATTREALIEQLEECQNIHTLEDGTIYDHASLTVYSQELTVFLGYNNMQLISDLTDWYDCKKRDWTYRTKHVGTNTIRNVWVNLIGATTPKLIQTALPPDAVGGGLTSRMIFVYADRKGKSIPLPRITDRHTREEVDLKHDITAINDMSGRFQIDDSFIEPWVEWYTTQEDNRPFQDPNFEGYFNRRPNHILKLCSIISASESDDMIVTDHTLLRAMDLLTRTEIMMPHTFSGVVHQERSAVITSVMTHLQRHEIVSEAELAAMFGIAVGGDRAFQEMMALLQRRKFCQKGTNETGTFYKLTDRTNGRSES